MKFKILKKGVKSAVKALAGRCCMTMPVNYFPGAPEN